MLKLISLIALVCFVSVVSSNLVPSFGGIKCLYNRTIKTLSCNNTRNRIQCKAIMAGSATVFKLFAISEMQSTNGTNRHHLAQWFHLYPKKLANDGWWYYKGKNSDKLSTGKLLLHTSDKTKGDVEGFLIPDLICWNKLKSMLSTSQKSDSIEVDKNVKSLLKKSSDEFKVIGTIEMLA